MEGGRRARAAASDVGRRMEGRGGAGVERSAVSPLPTRGITHTVSAAVSQCGVVSVSTLGFKIQSP